MEPQFKSKHRVSEHGEVWTGNREVEAMLDLVKQETERIESRFLEPACGNGNFLTAILERKLGIIEKRYKKSQIEFERYSILAVSSLYGIDILEDNVRECRARLLEAFRAVYVRLFAHRVKTKCIDAAAFILEQNIVWGDALTLKVGGVGSSNIKFAEWSLVRGGLIKRRDYSFHSLIARQEIGDLPLFSDLGEDVFLPTPEKDYPPMHYTEIACAQ